jgi:hypothetical protein
LYSSLYEYSGSEGVVSSVKSEFNIKDSSEFGRANELRVSLVSVMLLKLLFSAEVFNEAFLKISDGKNAFVDLMGERNKPMLGPEVENMVINAVPW